jgi:hypothetical protein
MIANSDNIIQINEDKIYDIIKDCLLHFNYSVDW